MRLDGSYHRTQDMLKMGLHAAVRNRELISDNMANVDTPGFKRSEQIFESQLLRAFEENQAALRDPFPALLKSGGHMPFEREVDWRSVKPKTNIDYLTVMRADGNNVDMEKESTLAAENQLRYSMMIQQMNSNFRRMSVVLRPV